MRLAINASYSGAKTFALEVFTREVVQWLCRIDENTIVFSPTLIPGVNESNIVLTSEATGAPAVSYFSNLMFNNTILPYQLASHRADVLFCPATEFPFVDVLPMPVMIMIHDVDPLFYPERFGLMGEYFKTALGHLHRQDIRALVVSNFLREQLLNNTGMHLSNIDIIRHGFDSQAFRVAKSDIRYDLLSEFAEHLGFSLPYILFCVEPGSAAMCDTVIAAFNDIKSRIRHSLLIVGLDREPSHNIQYLGSVDAVDMPPLLSCADLLIESSNAGNILEAMASGTPAIVSNTGALPEFVCDPEVLFNPSDSMSLSRGILRAIADKTLKQEMIDKGLKYVTRFSWEKTAEDIYASCVAAYKASYDRRQKTNK
ncbi:MAG: glycosyltransferase [Nitrospirae bacterium]|nr:glycosyltransferase [Nitrospirota bacterium]